ncbi:MAG: ATP-binding protein, partial [Bacteroidia bacterium]|nr:ATP-binding protein [Bacteroidia bacterium]
MKNSPFIYGSTVSKRSFTNREKEIKKLTANLLGGTNTMVISPRRWGKSSLVEHVTESNRNENKNIRIAMIDLFTVNSEEEFLEKFAGE